MKTWEINGNLDNIESGIINYQEFEDTVVRIKNIYDEIFGLELMNTYPLYIDNAVQCSGHVPIITPILNRFICIKLGIEDGKNRPQIAFQLAHELTHYVFYCLVGLNKSHAETLEETICSAASLLFVELLYPNEIQRYRTHLNASQVEGYRAGVQLAEVIKNDFRQFKSIVFSVAEKLRVQD